MTTYSYDAFGQPFLKIVSVDNDFLFTGEQMDTETGLVSDHWHIDILPGPRGSWR